MALGDAPYGQIVDDNRLPTMPYVSWFKQIFQICFALQDGGTTAQRPSDNKAILFLYRPYFDTTLGKPIWLKSVNPNVWVDATGATV